MLSYTAALRINILLEKQKKIIHSKVKLIILSECIYNMSPLITTKNLIKWMFYFGLNI